MKMKVPLRRTKVVMRHLPHYLSQSDIISHFDNRFSNRYNWLYFRPGKSSRKYQRYSRSYIELKRAEDVFEFAELFDGHVFVNEKGTQFKAIVDYAPSQRVPKPCTKKDSREGTIYQDPEYLEFLKLIAKPVENLPSAEIQLERKEAELSGAPKEPIIVTPLMEYVRNKRSAKSGTQGSLAVRKDSRRGRMTSMNKPGSSTSKKLDSEKKKYILKDSAKNASRKDKSTFITMPIQADQSASSTGKEISEIESSSVSGITLTSDSGNKKFLLLKGKEREISQVSDTALQQKGETSSVGNLTITTAPKQIQRREPGGRLISRILSKNEARQSQSPTAVRPQQKRQTTISENGKRLPRSVNTQSGSNGHVSNNDLPAFSSGGDTKSALDYQFMRKDQHGFGAVSEKQEKRTRNKDRPDRGVWAPLRRSDASQTTGERSSSTQHAQLLSNSVEATHVDVKADMPSGKKAGEVTALSSGHDTMENGSNRHHGCRVAAHIMKNDGCMITSEDKSSKRKGAAGLSAHEKQVWVQKPSSGY